jgi:hypothetical protein
MVSCMSYFSYEEPSILHSNPYPQNRGAARSPDALSNALNEATARSGLTPQVFFLDMPPMKTKTSRSSLAEQATSGFGARRPELFRLAWKDVGKVLIVAFVLDVIYELIVYRWF